jgi:hypothetical protein
MPGPAAGHNDRRAHLGAERGSGAPCPAQVGYGMASVATLEQPTLLPRVMTR